MHAVTSRPRRNSGCHVAQARCASAYGQKISSIKFSHFYLSDNGHHI
jgi:hypothetical protein